MELNFEEHISSKVKEANWIMGLIRRSFSFLDCHLSKKLYITLKHINIIENVQTRATKLVEGLRDIPYKERLKKLELPTLVYRRARGDMIELYKHFHIYDKDSLSTSFKPRERTSRKHGFQLHIAGLVIKCTICKF